MADFTFVTNRLATGAALTAQADVQALLQAGVTAVIDCRAEFDDAPLFTNSGLLYLWNPTQDDGQPKTPDWFARSLDFALPLFAKPAHILYTHCAAGVQRGPSTAYAILRALGLNAEEARDFIVTARPQAQIRYARDADLAIVALGYEKASGT